MLKCVAFALDQGNEEQLRAPEFQPFLDYIYFLSKAIAAADPLPSDVEFLYRGITKKLNKQLYQPGSTITWQVPPPAAFSGSCLLRPIRLPLRVVLCVWPTGRGRGGSGQEKVGVPTMGLSFFALSSKSRREVVR